MNDYFKYKVYYAIYWVIWFLITGLMVYSYKKDKPQVYRYILHLVMIRNIMPIINLEDREYNSNLVNIIFLIQMHFTFVIILEIFVCLVERALISIIYVIIVDIIVTYRFTVLGSNWPDTSINASNF